VCVFLLEGAKIITLINAVDEAGECPILFTRIAKSDAVTLRGWNMKTAGPRAIFHKFGFVVRGIPVWVKRTDSAIIAPPVITTFAISVLIFGKVRITRQFGKFGNYVAGATGLWADLVQISKPGLRCCDSAFKMQCNVHAYIPIIDSIERVSSIRAKGPTRANFQLWQRRTAYGLAFFTLSDAFPTIVVAKLHILFFATTLLYL
jgi:hypothetical protein